MVDDHILDLEPLNVCPLLSPLQEQYVTPTPYSSSKEFGIPLRDSKKWKAFHKDLTTDVEGIILNLGLVP